MNAAEVEFIAERELVTIVPNFTHSKIYLIWGEVGPFVPSVPLSVPLYLAIHFKQRQMCRIIPPNWMDVDKLEEVKQAEKDSTLFTKMPNEHYREVAQMLFEVAAEDIQRADEIQMLIKDVWDTRLAKLRSSVDAFIKSDQTHAKLNHLTSMEITTIRRWLPKSLDHLHKLRKGPASAAAADSESQDF